MKGILINLIFKVINVYFKNKNVKISWQSRISLDSEVGENSFIADGVRITRSQIGRYCSIGPNVMIGQGEHPISLLSTSVLLIESDSYNKLTKCECVISDDVWIGAGAVILRGVKVGRGAVVGANAVVTKDVPSYAIAVGVPAKVIKYRFDELTIKRIEESGWWLERPNDVKKKDIYIELVDNE
ncbi:TPA: CatB-related O-acetyltransferase [Vibrio vulnificus]|nr:antibiotic acetyltransferase [Vibrio vulnificus]